jgi:hypothetical protein
MGDESVNSRETVPVKINQLTSLVLYKFYKMDHLIKRKNDHSDSDSGSDEHNASLDALVDLQYEKSRMKKMADMLNDKVSNSI